MAVQVGGAAGALVPFYMIDTPLSYETFVGSGAVVVFNRGRDIIDIVYKNMVFLHDESCGKCTPCREGTEVMLEIYERLARGAGADNDLNLLEELAQVMAQASLCGLGQAAAVPVLDSLKHFRGDYVNRIRQSEFIRSYLGEKL
jgi:NADH:ubiquinone oxidoreductase subunit F (NADH-binding)